MKLIELLARELKEWPSDCTANYCVASDDDGEVFFGGPAKSFWLSEIAEDSREAKVTRQEWEQAVAARLTATTPTLETMLFEWRDLTARAQAAQAEADALFEHAGQCHGEIWVRLAELGWGAPRAPMVPGEPVVTLDDRWVMDGFVAPADATHFIPETDERKAAWMKCVGSEWWCLILGDSKWLVDELDDEDNEALISRPSAQQ